MLDPDLTATLRGIAAQAASAAPLTRLTGLDPAALAPALQTVLDFGLAVATAQPHPAARLTADGRALLDRLS